MEDDTLAAAAAKISHVSCLSSTLESSPFFCLQAQEPMLYSQYRPQIAHFLDTLSLLNGSGPNCIDLKSEEEATTL